ncbi:MAG: para-aminobenzoate synthetase component 1 [Marinoscillum sp.]|jgi:para-aminobenzoate synthetase component 1
MMLDREEAIKQINTLGTQREPFFFFTDFLGDKTWLKPITEIAKEDIDFVFHSKESKREKRSFKFEKFPLSKEAFAIPYQYVVDQINYGNSYLVNLTFKTPIKTDLSLKEIYEHSHAKYKVRFADQFVVFSPETFVKIKDGFIYSYPMKGTIDASANNAEAVLLNDAKEIAEHVTIVDLIRNDLSQIASKVEVTKFRFVSRLNTNDKNLLQVSSEIKGELPQNYASHLGELFFKLLPAGSISGAPKEQTIKIIKEAETQNRDFYTGVCGYFDGKNFDSGVIIRFIEKEGKNMYYRSGGGITSFSDEAKEYQEIIDKIYVPIY